MFLSSFGVGGERVGKAEARFSRRRWQFGDGKGGGGVKRVMETIPIHTPAALRRVVGGGEGTSAAIALFLYHHQAPQTHP